ncbi:inner membrane protein [Anseongella ginsenosidimutans]|uniref:Inner membrane protein n=1 Tax=Anseongella ginsenosidimutans TaxID=496056 RepID=A0A4R3KWY2_9SPHI|nr:cell envelope integrity protein CreD [Anseongella ginsenosidimutans]QEC51388.1 cell envelope integrity protein CreD [Anseongella ginsenosidimutans]TCS89908.1 inner membrane protein [Anseongella ginsenosidimutans]
MDTPQQTENIPAVKKLADSVVLKAVLIGGLTLLLLIPTVWIQSLIQERQQRQDEVIAEISDKWAGQQLLEGPVLLLPYKSMVGRRDTSGAITYKEVISTIHILPETLEITGSAATETLHRGIYDAVVYDADIKVSGRFSPLDLKKPGIDPAGILWNEAKVVIGLSDLKGLKNNPVIRLGSETYGVEPDFTSLKLFSHNLVILPDLGTVRNTGLDFSFDLDLKGSRQLSFLPLGKTTTVKLESQWNNPSFTGRYLPEERQVGQDGFTAAWTMPYFNRPYPQQWTGENTALQAEEKAASFGVEFLLPVDQYQKTMRSAKYAVLIILLTFAALFFSEFLGKRKVHPFQYLLIGAAMIIYYILLLSFSEQLDFNTAYLIASAATVILIGAFLAAILNKRSAAALAAILSTFYVFIFVLIQLQDLALLLGSVGLFLIVAVMMYFSAKMDWSRQLS